MHWEGVFQDAMWEILTQRSLKTLIEQRRRYKDLTKDG